MTFSEVVCACAVRGLSAEERAVGLCARLGGGESRARLWLGRRWKLRKGDSLRGGLEDTAGRERVLDGGVPGGLVEAGEEEWEGVEAGLGLEVGVEVEVVVMVVLGAEMLLEVGAGRMMGVAASFLLRRKRWMCFSMVAGLWWCCWAKRRSREGGGSRVREVKVERRAGGGSSDLPRSFDECLRRRTAVLDGGLL